MKTRGSRPLRLLIAICATVFVIVTPLSAFADADESPATTYKENVAAGEILVANEGVFAFEEAPAVDEGDAADEETQPADEEIVEEEVLPADDEIGPCEADVPATEEEDQVSALCDEGENEDEDEDQDEDGDEDGITPFVATEIIDLGAKGPVRGKGWEFDGKHTYKITGNVTVTNSSGYSEALIFNIQNNKNTVTWKANYSNNGGLSKAIDGVFLSITGKGAFVAENSRITYEGPGSTIKTGKNISLTIKDSIIEVIGDEAECTAENAECEVFGDEAECIAVNAEGSVSVEKSSDISAGGAGFCTAVKTEGALTVKDSAVHTMNTSLYGVAIRADKNVDINVRGNSSVSGTGGAILAKKSAITVSDSATIKTPGLLNYHAGQLFGNAITARSVTIRDGARVEARNGAAVLYSASLDISGGLVFAYGYKVGGASFKINADGEQEFYLLNTIFKISNADVKPGAEYRDLSRPEKCVRDSGIALAWDYISYYEYVSENEGDFPYLQGVDADTTDLYIYPDKGVEYSWVYDSGAYMIWCKNSKNGKDAINTYYILVDFSLSPEKPVKPDPKPDDEGGGTGEPIVSPATYPPVNGQPVAAAAPGGSFVNPSVPDAPSEIINDVLVPFEPQPQVESAPATPGPSQFLDMGPLTTKKINPIPIVLCSLVIVGVAFGYSSIFRGGKT